MSNTFNSNEVLVDSKVKKDFLENLKIGKREIVSRFKLRSQFVFKCKKMLSTIILLFTAFAVVLP